MSNIFQSYSLWYTPSNSTHRTPHHESLHPDSNNNNNNNPNVASQAHRRHASHRTPLSRLRLDEEYMARRKLNIQNYGNTWLKPPGIPKTLYQQREERREMEEHQEALRREQLAQELAEAEQDEMLQGEGVDGEDDGARDLDDDVPEDEGDRTGLTIESEESEGEDEENDPEGRGGERSPGDNGRGSFGGRGGGIGNVPVMLVTPRLPARVPDDVYREALARGEDPEPNGFDDGGSTIDDEGHGMLQEEDLVHEGHGYDIDMDADLDAEIPDADEPSGYEHTDTEDELSSSEEDDESVDAGRLPLQNPAASMVRSDGTQNSMDLNSLISGSSQVGSSPQLHSGRRRLM